MNKPLKIVGIVRTDSNTGACEAYRVLYPLKALENTGCKTAVATGMEIELEYKKGRNPLGNVDVVMFQRVLAKDEKDAVNLVEAVKALRASGIAVVVDYDDDYTNDHREVHPGIMPDLKAYSAVTVSTPYLKSVMKPFAEKVVVHPNGIVPQLFASKRFKRVIPKISIGLTGSASHKNDWEPAIEGLKRVVKKREDVTAFISGYLPESAKEIPRLKTLREFVPNAETDNFFIDLNSYGAIHANIDILLCPVNPDDRFNWSKSNLKSIEGMASARDVGGKTGGSCVIATGGNLPIYKDSVIHEKTGFLVENHHNPDAWEEAIKIVVSNVELRNKLQIAGYQHCMQQFTVQKLAADRLATYRRLSFEAKKHSGKYLAELALLETK